MVKCRLDKKNERGIGIGTYRQSGGKRASLEEKIVRLSKYIQLRVLNHGNRANRRGKKVQDKAHE